MVRIEETDSDKSVINFCRWYEGKGGDEGPKTRGPVL